MDRAAVPHRIASTALQPFRRWGGSWRKVRLRAALWRLAGSGILMRGLHLPRDDLLIDPGNTVVPDYIEIALNGKEPTVLRGCLDTLRESGARVLLKNYGIEGNG